jgi:hypothetical protein
MRYSITSSARVRSDGEIARPSAFAVFRFITSSNWRDCATGSSAGLAPEDAAGVDAELMVGVGELDVRSSSAAYQGIIAKLVDRRQLLLSREGDDASAPGVKARIGRHQLRSGLFLHDCRKGRLAGC